jgi:hypothetical protein
MGKKDVPEFDIHYQPEDDDGFQKKDWTVAEVVTIPPCDYCGLVGAEKPAEYDAKTKFNGVWAWMCEKHWIENRVTEELGLGIGQKLVKL